jgi:hypothetical protein
LTAVVEQMQPLLAFLHSQASLPQTLVDLSDPPRGRVDIPTPHPDPIRASAPVDIPTPHPRADPKRAAELNRRYLEELARWTALPWWKRRAAKKPERPTGI